MHQPLTEHSRLKGRVNKERGNGICKDLFSGPRESLIVRRCKKLHRCNWQDVFTNLPEARGQLESKQGVDSTKLPYAPGVHRTGPSITLASSVRS